MKIKLLTAFLFSGLALFAQQNETKKIVKIKGNDTTIIVINSRIDQMDSLLTEEMKNIYINDSSIKRVDVFIDTTIVGDVLIGSPSDTTQIKIGNMKIVILESKDLKAMDGETPKGQRKIIIDEKVIIENDDERIVLNDGKDSYSFEKGDENWNNMDNDDWSGDGNPIWAGIGINANGFLKPDKQFPTTNELGFLTLDPAKSIGLQVNFAEKRFPILKDYLGVVTGLGFQWNRYALKGAYDLTVVNDTLVGVNTGLNYSKNVLTSTYLQAPLLLQISTNKNPNAAWNISAGVVGGIRVDARQVQKWESDGKKNKDKTKDDFQFNPFQASLMATVGYGDWSLYVTYGLSDVFIKGAALKARGVNAGILLSF
ncbi:MAG: outer membrane beta-barrel protein [Sphingomonadales bacterium]